MDDDINEEMMMEVMKPLDQDSIDHLMKIAAEVEHIAKTAYITAAERGTLEIASQQILILCSKALAGYNLYSEYRFRGKELLDETKFNRLIAESRDTTIFEGLSDDAIKDFEALLVDPDIIFGDAK